MGDSKLLKEFTDEELQKELMRREKIRRGPILGYRAICYGDDYNYGGYTDRMIGPKMNKKKAKQWAEEDVAQSQNGGYVMEIYKDTPKEGRIH